MIILQSVQSIFSILIMISVGYFLAEKKWFNDDSAKLLSKLVTVVALPPFMIQNLVSNFDKEKLSELSSGLVIPFLSMFICYLIGSLFAELLKVPHGRKGTFKVMFFVSNTVFIGLPVNLALFGEKSIPYALLFYIGNTIFFWTIGIYSIRKDGDGKDARLFSLDSLRKIFSPPLIGFLIGILIVIADIKLPGFVIDTCKYLGNMTTPLSMLFIGITIHSVDFKEIHFSKDMAAILLGRFLISPLIVILIAHFFKFPELMISVFIIQSSMPVMTQTSILAKAYNSDYKYAAVMTTVTTLASLVTIPVYMYIIHIIRFFI